MSETCLKDLQNTRSWVNKGRPLFVNQSISQNYAHNAEWQNDGKTKASTFGDVQMSALADMIQAVLMLRYNKRTVG